MILIGQPERGGCSEWHVPSCEFEGEAFLVDRLQEPAAPMPIDLEDCSLDREYLIRIKQMFGLIVAHFLTTNNTNNTNGLVARRDCAGL